MMHSIYACMYKDACIVNIPKFIKFFTFRLMRPQLSQSLREQGMLSSYPKCSCCRSKWDSG